MAMDGVRLAVSEHARKGPPARIARFCLPDERRLHQRSEALINVDAQAGSQAPWSPCRIVDLSEEGCRIAGCGVLAEGRVIAIAMPGFAPRRGRVMWAQDNMAGCRFERPLPAAIFDHIVHMSDPRGRG